VLVKEWAALLADQGSGPEVGTLQPAPRRRKAVG
jgi:hypothetical protein